MSVFIYNFRFAVALGAPDKWLPFGTVNNHPNFPPESEIFTSSPVEYDKKNKILKTASGRIYKIESFDAGEEEKWENELQKEIERVLRKV